MSILAKINHRTIYMYDRPVFLSTHLFRLKPAAHSPAEVKSYNLIVSPSNHYFHSQQDVFGNFIARIDFMGKMQEMSVEVNLTVNLHPYNPFNFFIESYAQFFPFSYPDTLSKDLWPYLEIVDRGSKLLTLAGKAALLTGGIIDFLVKLNNMIYQEINYTIRMSPGVQTSEESLQSSMGSCRDSAWLLVQLLRHLGLASRFVSGYLVQFPADLSKGTVDLHAWAEVYIPGAGWIGLDPTSGLLTNEGHIPLACNPRPSDAAPVTGTTDPCLSTLSYESTVTRL